MMLKTIPIHQILIKGTAMLSHSEMKRGIVLLSHESLNVDVILLHFIGSRSEGNQVLEERAQFASVEAVRQSGQELFSWHSSENRTPPIRMRGAMVLVAPRATWATFGLVD